MNKRLLSIIIAAVMALMSVVMVNAYLNREKQKYKIEHKEMYVVVASRDIPRGATIQPDMVKTRAFPQKYAQPKVLQNSRSAVGKIALGDIIKGEQILATKLTVVRRVQDSLAVRLPQGKRAYTIRFEDYQVNAVGGQVKIGDFVDVIGIFPYPKMVGGQQMLENVSVILFENILTMGIQSEGEGKLIFTFALTSQEAAVLTYAKTLGKLRLILRHPLDTEVGVGQLVEETVFWQYILSKLGRQLVQPKDEAARIEAPPSEPATLEIYRGTSRERMRLD